MAVEISSLQEKSTLQHCSAFQKIRPTRGFRSLAITISTLLLSVVACLILIPWQQSISGTGKVTVYNPMERPQNIDTSIAGRILKWHVREGQTVQAGQLLVELTEIDSKYLDPQQLTHLQETYKALLARKEATQARIISLKSQTSMLGQSRKAAIPSAGVKVDQAENKIQASIQAVTAAKQALVTAELNLKRIRKLHEHGLRSTRDLELAQQTYIETSTKLGQAETSLSISAQDQRIAGFDQNKLLADTAASLSNAQASIAGAYETLASTNSDLAKLQVDIHNLKQRIAQRRVVAPRSGTVVRILSAGPGETVTEGDIIATIVPTTSDQAVELLISDNDAPLVSIGRPVRLQFAGWPALQFSGWPAVAVGTFAGRVSVIDAVDDGTSRYRVWVKPDEALIKAGKEQPWPASHFLRPGSKAIGWVMLNKVPLWYELWRQFNAFPPSLSEAPTNEKSSKSDNTGPKEYIKKPKKK